MGKDSIDFYETIRKINEQNRRLDDSTRLDENTTSATQWENALDDWKNYLAGVLLLLWTISPVLASFISLELMLSALLCIYPLFSPFIWFLLSRWKPDGFIPTIILDLVGHVLLFLGVFWRMSGKVGNSYYFGFEIIGVMLIVAVIIASAIGSIFIILFGASRS